jgi:hypothetical protein
VNIESSEQFFLKLHSCDVKEWVNDMGVRHGFHSPIEDPGLKSRARSAVTRVVSLRLSFPI